PALSAIEHFQARAIPERPQHPLLPACWPPGPCLLYSRNAPSQRGAHGEPSGSRIQRCLESASARIGPIAEWHLDLEKIVTMEKLGSYPACPDSRKKPDLRAIRPIARGVSGRRALAGVAQLPREGNRPRKSVRRKPAFMHRPVPQNLVHALP